MTTRTEFLARVSCELGRPAGAGSVAPCPDVDERLVRLMGHGEDVASLFATRAAAAGMVVHRCIAETLAQTVKTLLMSLGAKGVVLDHLEPPLARPIADAVSGCAARIIDPRAAKGLDAQFDASAGITGVVCAIAETGTLVVVSDAKRSRGTFMIPPVHVAIVLETQIIPDMIDLWGQIGNRPPTATTLISGPSKTADIEGILVTGVHGPGSVHVILISDEPKGLPARTSPRNHIHGDRP